MLVTWTATIFPPTITAAAISSTASESHKKSSCHQSGMHQTLICLKNLWLSNTHKDRRLNASTPTPTLFFRCHWPTTMYFIKAQRLQPTNLRFNDPGELFVLHLQSVCCLPLLQLKKLSIPLKPQLHAAACSCLCHYRHRYAHFLCASVQAGRQTVSQAFASVVISSIHSFVCLSWTINVYLTYLSICLQKEHGAFNANATSADDDHAFVHRPHRHQQQQPQRWWRQLLPSLLGRLFSSLNCCDFSFGAGARAGVEVDVRCLPDDRCLHA